MHMPFGLKYMISFRGYPSWDIKTKNQALEKVLHDRIETLITYEYEDAIDILVADIKESLEYYEEHEEFEICVLLKDLLDNL